MKEAGVQTEYKLYEGAVHAFYNYPGYPQQREQISIPFVLSDNQIINLLKFMLLKILLIECFIIFSCVSYIDQGSSRRNDSIYKEIPIVLLKARTGRCNL